MKLDFPDLLRKCREPFLLWFVLVAPLFLMEKLTAFRWSDFRFQREQILGGQWWRMLTGHLDHLGWEHLLLNAVFLAVCLIVFSPLRRFVRTAIIWLITVLLISSLMLVFSPNLSWYVGLSASLYSLLVIGALTDKNFPLMLRVGVVVLVGGKVIMEQGAEQLWVANFISGPVSQVSHLYGYCVGLVIALTWMASQQIQRKAG